MGRNFNQVKSDPKIAGSLNIEVTYEIIRQCALLGISDFCISPGGRNAAFIDCLEECYPESRSYYFHDERSAGFFAIGLANSNSKPVCVITTSGSAVVELFPSIMEAYYSKTPILAITADRPKKFRGSGAPQSAEQKNIFGIYCDPSFDIENQDELNLNLWNKKGPAHINVCLEETYHHSFTLFPMIELKKNIKNESEVVDEYDLNDIRDFFKNSLFPLIIVGGLLKKDREAVISFLLKINAPTYCEAISGLREEKILDHILIRSPNHIHKLTQCSGYKIDLVIRIGTVPTLRFWRDLEHLNLPVFSISHLPFSGLSNQSVKNVDISNYLNQLKNNIDLKFYPLNLMILDRNLSDDIEGLYLEEPNAEQSLIHALSERIPNGARIFLGNSLSIRNWDLYATFENRHFEIYANRGINGIDGQISTFLGLVDPNKYNFAIIGDLTALYDLTAPWILEQLGKINISIIIINNNGGKIFKPLFKNPKIQNNHSFSFKAFAEMWGMKYQCLSPKEVEMLSDFEGVRVIECLPDNDSTTRFSEKIK